MHTTTALDMAINSYLGHLNTQQKEVVLSVVKTFAGEEDSWWEMVETAAQPAIQEALLQEKEGKVTSNAVVMKSFEQWQ